VASEQPSVAAYFDRLARPWRDIYDQQDVFSIIVQQRQAIALNWIDHLSLPAGASVLEVGSGAGVLAVELAKRGLRVTAAEISLPMLSLNRAGAAQAGVLDRVQLVQADAHALPLCAERFDLVVALGLIQWMHSPPQVMRELARVLRPKGYLVVQVGNRARIDWWLDPLHNLSLQRPRQRLRATLQSFGLPLAPRSVRDVMHSRRELVELLSDAGLQPLAMTTYGFGPFTLLGREVVPNVIGVPVQRTLQRLADRQVAGVSAVAKSRVALARKEQPVRVLRRAELQLAR
jgi:ubiquinone/menaquinone biosynthesis C-methylase UbiE